MMILCCLLACLLFQRDPKVKHELEAELLIKGVGLFVDGKRRRPYSYL